MPHPTPTPPPPHPRLLSLAPDVSSLDVSQSAAALLWLEGPGRSSYHFLRVEVSLLLGMAHTCSAWGLEAAGMLGPRARAALPLEWLERAPGSPLRTPKAPPGFFAGTPGPEVLLPAQRAIRDLEVPEVRRQELRASQPKGVPLGYPPPPPRPGPPEGPAAREDGQRGASRGLGGPPQPPPPRGSEQPDERRARARVQAGVLHDGAPSGVPRRRPGGGGHPSEPAEGYFWDEDLRVRESRGMGVGVGWVGGSTPRAQR